MALEWARTLHGFADDPVAALDPIERAVALAPGLHGARFERALLHLQLSRPEEALADLDALLATGMRHPELLQLHRARALELKGASSEALEAWRAAIRAARPSSWLHWQHGRLARRLGRLHEAADALERSIARASEAGELPDPELRLDLAEVQLEMGALDQARARLQEAAAALWPEETHLHARYARLKAGLEGA